VTLPATAAAGSIIQVQGVGAGGWQIQQNSSQNIQMLASTTTTGTGGSLGSVDPQAGVTLLCTTADTNFFVVSAIGNVTLV